MNDDPAREADPQPQNAYEPAIASTRTHGIRDWLREGLRAGFLLAPRVDSAPQPAQVAAIAAIVLLLGLGLSRLEVDGAAVFDLQAWLAPWWSASLLILVSWWALSPQRNLAAWWVLWMGAGIPVSVAWDAMSIANGHGVLDALQNLPWLGWAIYGGLLAWTLAAELRLARRFVASWPRFAVLAFVLVGINVIMMYQFTARPWHEDYALRAEAEEAKAPKFQPSQEMFEGQQRLLQSAVAAIAPGRAEGVNVYGIVFAPYASQDVFLRESAMVAGVLADRFDAKGRVLQLVNHAATSATLPWATPLNLKRSVDAMAGKMDRDRDVLVVYLTSHGARDFKLAASHWPLSVASLTPGELRKVLDESGVRNRVVIVSACYSGGWVGPLASESTLVMTAADADHTSYGCGSRSELTYFGRAVFDEQLRRTHSFEQAFTAAVPVIKQREIEGKKQDGFSNPQISVGERIRPVLDELQRRLDTRPAAG